ncbi:MAG: site-specific integrase [Carbonactinosporaceae bacterium]
MAGKQRRSNGEGTIYRRKDGRYEVAVFVTTPDGRRVRKRAYGRTREQAHARYVELLDKARRGVPVADRTWKVGEYLDYWLEHVAPQAFRPATRALYETMTRLYLKPGLGKQRLERLTVANVQSFFNSRLRAGDSVRKVQVMRTALSSALTRATREELVTRNVARLTTLPEDTRKEVHPWSVEEARLFLASTRESPLHVGFVLLLFLGMRRGEVLGLRWHDVDSDAGELRIRQQLQRIDGQLVQGPVKSRAARRTLPLFGVVEEAVTEQSRRQAELRQAAGERWHETGLVLTTRTGRPVEPRNFYRDFQLACDRTRIRRVPVHAMRHTCASLLKSLNVPPRDAMSILGHSRISVTLEVYTHADAAAQRAALTRISDALSG